MTRTRNVALALALAACAGLTAGTACAAEPSSHQKKLAALAADEAAFKRAEGAQGRQEEQTARALKERQDAFDRLCKIKPVMSDPEIDGCKKAYKL